MNSRRGNEVLAAIVSLLWLAGGCDLRAAEERPASFDCGKDRTPLALIVCGDQKATAAERRTATAYLALYFSLDGKAQASFQNDHMRWVNDLVAQCFPSQNLLQKILGPALVASSGECVTRAYTLRAESYRRKLHASALEEAKLSSNELRGIQRRLLELKFLSGKIDGMFGAATRLAIRNYQMSIGHAQANFLTGDERNMLLASTSTPPPAATETPAPAETSISTKMPINAPAPPPLAPAITPPQVSMRTPAPVETPISTSTPISEPETPPKVPSQRTPTGQSNQNPESRPLNVEANTPAAGQSEQRALVEDVNQFAEAVADQSDEPAKTPAQKPQALHFTHGTVFLLITVLAGMAIFLWTGTFLLKRLHWGRGREVDYANPVGPVASLPGPNRIPTASSQLVAAGPIRDQESSDQQVGAGTTLNEDAIASIIVDMVRKRADAS